MKLPAVFLSATIALTALGTAASTAPHTIDGDTIVLAGETVRILNIDAPD